MKLDIKLRPLELSDLDNLLLIENDKRYWYLSDTTRPYTEEELTLYISNAKTPLQEAGQYRFVIESNNEFVGLIDLYEYNSKTQSAGVGVFILDVFRNKGFAQESLLVLKEYSKFKLKLKQLFARIEDDNYASIKVFEKCGFKKVKGLKNYINKKGVMKDCSEYWADL